MMSTAGNRASIVACSTGWLSRGPTASEMSEWIRGWGLFNSALRLLPILSERSMMRGPRRVLDCLLDAENEIIYFTWCLRIIERNGYIIISLHCIVGRNRFRELQKWN